MCDIRSLVSQVTKSIAARTANHLKDYGAALEKVRILDAAGELTELQILKFIADRKFELAVARLLFWPRSTSPKLNRQ